MVEVVVSVLTDSNDPKQYTRRMRSRDEQLSKGWVQFVLTLTVETPGGAQKMNCANTEAMFRIIQSIPSPKAEPFKLWLAKVGYERVQEIENPELAAERARQYYRDLGYDEKWIETRLQTITIRGQLTDEWKTRGVHHVRRRRHTPKCHKKRCSRLCGKSRRCLLKAVLLPAKP